MATGGGFPLDSIVGERRVGFGFCHSEANKETNPTCSQWGPQTLSIYCPPYDYQYASSQTDRYGASTANLCKNGSIMVGLGPRTPLLLRQPLPPRVLGSSARTLPKSPRQDIVRNKHGVPCCNSFFWTKKRNLCRRNHAFLHFFGVLVIQWMVNVFSCGQIYYKLLSLLTSMFEKGSIK